MNNVAAAMADAAKVICGFGFMFFCRAI
jgi:hypothetical protein